MPSMLILHSLDDSTKFLNIFQEKFPENYLAFDTDAGSILHAKEVLGDLEDNSLIVYLGHGSSNGLYIPNSENNYKDLFLDVKWGNHYFQGHDILLICCNSAELISRIHTYNSGIGFGNIISSDFELEHHNANNKIKKILTKEEIDMFNETYVNISISILAMIENQVLNLAHIFKYYRYFLNKEINKILLNDKITNRVELACLLFELRDQMVYSSKK